MFTAKETIMKRLPIMIISAGLLTASLAACGTGQSGVLGPAPTGADRPASLATSLGGAQASASPSASGGQPTTPGPATRTPAGPAPTTSAGSAPSTARQISLQLWFTRDGKLFSTRRDVPATTGVGRAAVGSLLTGPAAAEYAAGLRSQIPAGTRLLGLRIAAGTATVNLTSPFTAAASPAAMALRIGQVVDTLAQFPSVTGVRFEINGQGVTTLGGVPVQAAQTPAMYAGYLPAITVESPLIGRPVSSPVTVSGTADVFEAVVSVRVLDSAGNEIARTFTMASCGTGCRGDYSVAVSYTVPADQPGTVQVFESSAKNGQPVNVQLIPVRLSA